MSSDPPSDPRDALFDVSHLQKDIGAQTGRSAVLVLCFSAIKLVLALGTTAILARLILPVEHGLLALAIPAVAVASGLSEFGLAQAVTQRRKVTHSLASALFWVNLSLGLILGCIVFLLAGPAAAFYQTPEVKGIFQVLSLYVFLSVLNTQYMALLRRQMRVGTIEKASTLATVMAAFAAISLALLGFGVEALVAQLLLVQGLSFVGLQRSTRWVPSGPQSLWRQPLGAVLSYGGYLAAERVLNDFARNIQLALVGRFFGTIDAGLYYRADSLAQMPQRRVLSPLSAAFIPALSRLQDDSEGFRRMLCRQIARSNLIVLLVGALIVGLSDAVVHLVLGPNWEDSAPILALLGIYVAAAPTLSCMAWALVAVGQSRRLFLFRLVNTAVILGAVLTAAGTGFSIIGVTVTYVLASGVFGLLHLGIWLLISRVITPADLGAILADTVGAGLLLLGGAAALRAVLDLPMWTEACLTGAMVTVITLGLALGRPGPRTDILKLIRRRR